MATETTSATTATTAATDELHVQAADAAAEEFSDLGDDALLASEPAVQARFYTDHAGTKRRVFVRRLDTQPMIATISDIATIREGGKSGALKSTDMHRLKIKRCIAREDGSPRFTDVQLEELFGPTGNVATVQALLALIHVENPLLKNA
jgi:hypothetical protein